MEKDLAILEDKGGETWRSHVMEYLSRILKSVRSLPDFKFHPMCKQVKLTHLIFVDVVWCFVKGK